MAGGDSTRSLMGSMAACRKQSPKDVGAEESSTLFLRETCSDSCCQSTATSAQIASLMLMPIISQPEGPRCCPALYPQDHGTSETGALVEWGKQQFDKTESELAFVVWFFSGSTQALLWCVQLYSGFSATSRTKHSHFLLLGDHMDRTSDSGVKKRLIPPELCRTRRDLWRQRFFSSHRFPTSSHMCPSHRRKIFLSLP